LTTFSTCRSPLIPDDVAVLQSRKQLTERLRQAWKRSRAGKLDIYLNHANKATEPSPKIQQESEPQNLQKSTSMQELPLTTLENNNVVVLDINENLKQVNLY
jgi:hypothetical protein